VLTAQQPEFDAWVNAVQAATRLAGELARIGRDRAIDPTRLRAVMGVSKTLPAVSDPFAVPAGKKEPDPLPARAKPADLLQYERLAAGTALPPESRRRAWDTIRADRRAFHEAAREQDAADDAANDPTTNPTPAAETGRVREDELTIRRAQASVELLKLAGYAKAGELDAPLGRLKRDPASDAEPLGRLLRKAWAEAATDRAARATPPGATHLRDTPKESATDPRATSAYRGWVRDQLLADQKLRPKAAGTDKFYEQVKQDLKLSPD
jgi:hypothetical protein